MARGGDLTARLSKHMYCMKARHICRGFSFWCCDLRRRCHFKPQTTLLWLRMYTLEWFQYLIFASVRRKSCIICTLCACLFMNWSLLPHKYAVQAHYHKVETWFLMHFHFLQLQLISLHRIKSTKHKVIGLSKGPCRHGISSRQRRALECWVEALTVQWDEKRNAARWFW